MSDRIQVGDVCLDLAQGRPVHVIEDTGQSANEWSAENNYSLTENYGNSRLGTGKADRVYEVVYCSNAKSEPSQTYGMPESRLLRVETEAADDGRPVAERAHCDVLERLFAAAFDLEWRDDDLPDDWYRGALEDLIIEADSVDTELMREAKELADVEQTIGGEGDE